MANQTITASTNHDSLTGRGAGEDITIQQGAVLTIDSMPQRTAMGILGDITLTEGEVHIDGRYVRAVTYSGGTGTLPAVGVALTYGTSGTAKVIEQTSGTNAAGVLTITIQGVLEEPNGTITDGAWSATVSSSVIGLLKVFGEDQIWDATDALSTFRVTGDWYQIGVGTGADSQVITLPHTGVQPAVWVETGNGTNVFQIWHRVGIVASSVFWDSVSDWGNTWESGYVFSAVPGSGTLTFGTSTNGGAPPSGARIRIPNVHMGTTTTGAPTTEVMSLTATVFLEAIDSGVTENVYIDHLNASTVNAVLNQTNGAAISDSCFSIWSAVNYISRNNAPVTLDNCAWVSGSGLAGDTQALSWIVLDNLGGVTMTDCLVYAGANATNNSAAGLITSANVLFEGTNKFVANQQDENTMASLRGTTAANVTNNGLLILLNAGIITLSGCSNWQLGDIAYGQLSTRGATEDSMVLGNIGATQNMTIDSGRLVTGGSTVEDFAGDLFIITDSSNINVSNFGDVDAKINSNGRGGSICNAAGITNNVIFRRVWYTNRSTTQSLELLNSCFSLQFYNCSCDYNDELEIDASDSFGRGFHGGSGTLNSATGAETNLLNVVDTIFIDHFKSDTTGALTMIFTPPSTAYSPYVEIVSGTPVFNNIGDVAMRTTGDQIIFTWPYLVLGHTSFRNASMQLVGTNTGNLTYEYDLDTGSGYSGSYSTISGANLSAETISATGFGVKVRITCVTGAVTNRLNGLSILTNTTIAAQKANLYPLPEVLLTITGIVSGAEVRIYDDNGVDALDFGTELDGIENNPSTTFEYSHSGAANDIVVQMIADGYMEIIKRTAVGPNDLSLALDPIVDSNL